MAPNLRDRKPRGSTKPTINQHRYTAAESKTTKYSADRIQERLGEGGGLGVINICCKAFPLYDHDVRNVTADGNTYTSL